LELGGKTSITRFVDLDLTGYYELFYNEFVTQAPAGTSGTSSYTSNAPRSRHQGVEAKIDVYPLAGFFWSSAFTFNDHEYTEFSEKLSTTTAAVDRKGKKIPGVERFQLNSRLGYDTAKINNRMSAGGFIEVNWVDKFYINNSNTFEQPSYVVWNANLHASKSFDRAMFKSVTFFFDCRNVFNKKYIGSSLVVADSPTSTPTSLASSSRAFFSGSDRSYFGGVKLAF
jgi:iron complex outermembrane receptor protein